MGGPAYDVVGNPLGAVRQLFDAAKQQAGGDVAALGGSDWGVPELFSEALFRNGLIDRVPFLDSASLPASAAKQRLVRFRGMVQDMWDTEFYQGLYKGSDGTLRTSKYSDLVGEVAGREGGRHVIPPGREGGGHVIHDMDTAMDCTDAESALWERQVIYCTPVPGLQAWAGGAPQDAPRGATQAAASTNGGAQGVMSAGAGGDVSMEEEEGGSAGAGAGQRRGFGGGAEPQAKRRCVDTSEGQPMDVVVKIYGTNPTSTLKLNDVVELVGVVSWEPPSTEHQQQHQPQQQPAAPAGAPPGAEAAAAGGQLSAPAAAAGVPVQMLAEHDDVKAPRLHCLAWRKLPSLWPEPSAAVVAGASSLRASLLAHLTSSLGGDATAAEYFLLHLISRVHSRVEPMALGKLSLNLIGKPNGPSPTPGHANANPSPQAPAGAQGGTLVGAVQSAVDALRPVSVSLDLRRADISSQRFTPWKDYNANRLVGAPLQLPAGAHLTVNEGTLDPGAVSELAVANLKALSDLCQWQKVAYDFQYYNMDMPADVAILVLSEARSRILPCDVALPVVATAPYTVFPANHPELDSWHQFIGFARQLEHHVENPMQTRIEGDLVAARQADRSKGSDTFHRWLTMARLMAASHGSEKLTVEHWEAVRRLENKIEGMLKP